MSNRQSPKGSKSRSCHSRDEEVRCKPTNDMQEEVLEELEKQVEKEIATSERLLNATSTLTSRSKGSQYKRTESVCDPPRSAPSASPRPTFQSTTYLRMPTPPQQTPSPYSSKVPTPNISQKGSRRRTPEMPQEECLTPVERRAVAGLNQRSATDNLFYDGNVTFPTQHHTGPHSYSGQSDRLNANYMPVGSTAMSRMSSKGPLSAQKSVHVSPYHASTTSPANLSRNMVDVVPADCPEGDFLGDVSETSNHSRPGYFSGTEVKETAGSSMSRNLGTAIGTRPTSASSKRKSGSPSGGRACIDSEGFSQRSNANQEEIRPGSNKCYEEMEKAAAKYNLRNKTNSPVPCRREATQSQLPQVMCPTEAPSNLQRNGHSRSPLRQDTHQDHSRRQSPPHAHHHHHHNDRNIIKEVELEPMFEDFNTEAALAYLSQIKKTPPYVMCKINQVRESTNATACTKKGKPNLPEIPCLQKAEIDELVNCEKQDVELTNFLASEVRKSYKKPCPKQTKAQMNVKELMNAYSRKPPCGENYTPLDHPDPDDISPEMAANMMFTQEKGIKMDACPKETVKHLFPDEPKPGFPRVPRSTISIVDPNQKEEMIEKSASVPSEGVSDSAYTRTMKEKGEDSSTQRSLCLDFAIGQSKREYVFVAEKPLRFSKVQFRGGSYPSWFPGYFSAFPGEDGTLKSIPSPSGLFQKAWAHTNPRNVASNDVIVLE